MSSHIVIASAELVDHESCVRRLEGGQYLQDGRAEGTYQRDDEWMRLTNLGTDYRDADPDSLTRIQAAIPNAQFLYAESNSDFLMGEFVLSLPDHASLMIINPMGLVLPLHTAKALALSDEPWMRLVEL